ncbi:hypothetical protein GVN20_26915 [Runella sp. CRIBMP]|uniref:hypothetical protein n=1 Tax=Runella sp. CRIBMP TaxID=2683261 RepID=UPI001412BC38|nr:hypothetical protein [Runella sp. CRIBMP]NBB23016.1 hypothetical protein [Runella sp. CRIBMP]
MTPQGTISSERFLLRYTIDGEGPPMVVIGSAAYYPRTFMGDIRQQLQLLFIDHRSFAQATSPQPNTGAISMDVLIENMEPVRQTLGIK